MVRAREDDFPHKSLGAPALVHESVGEVVEQFGMRRAFASCAEVVGGPDEPFAHQPKPNPVDIDPSGQGVGRIREPIS